MDEAEIVQTKPAEYFRQLYIANLVSARKRRPEDYLWPESKLQDVVERMVQALARGTAQVRSPAVRATCRQLGIANTIGAIRGYLNG